MCFDVVRQAEIHPFLQLEGTLDGAATNFVREFSCAPLVRLRYYFAAPEQILRHFETLRRV